MKLTDPIVVFRGRQKHPLNGKSFECASRFSRSNSDAKEDTAIVNIRTYVQDVWKFIQPILYRESGSDRTCEGTNKAKDRIHIFSQKQVDSIIPPSRLFKYQEYSHVQISTN